MGGGENTLTDSEKTARKAMEHFNMDASEVGKLCIVKNAKEMIEWHRLKLFGMEEYKKFRTIIDYDSDYEVFTIRIFPH